MSGLYRHVVLFKFKESATSDQVIAVERGFRAFCDGLPFVRSLEWGRNSSPEGYDDGLTHCFIVGFDGPAERDLYLPHPAHVAFCETLLDPVLERAVV